MASQKLVALDIGSSSLKAIEATLNKGAVKIHRVYTLPLEAEIVSSGRVVSPDLLRTALRRLWREARFSTRNVALLASGYEQSTDRVVDKLPWSSTHDDFKVLLPSYLKQIPEIASFYEDGSKYYVDEHTLNEFVDPRDGRRYKKSLVTFLSREYVDSIISSAEDTKLVPEKMDTLPFSLIRSFINSQDEIDPNEIICSVDIGAAGMNVTVHKNGQPIYIHTVDLLGGRRITDRIASELRVSFAQAEYLKLAVSVPAEELPELNRSMVLPSSEARNMRLEDFSQQQVTGAINIISQEVYTIIQNVNDVLYVVDGMLHDDESFGRIVVSGGSGKLRDLLARMASELEVKTEMLNPFAKDRLPRVKQDVSENLQAYTGVYGLLVEKNG
jgi:type IV pilus assembly protein PilM